MTISIKGEIYYRTAEACQLAGIHRNTYFRWLREGLLTDVGIRDRRGWRLFSQEDLDGLKNEANRVTDNSKKPKEARAQNSLESA